MTQPTLPYAPPDLASTSAPPARQCAQWVQMAIALLAATFALYALRIEIPRVRQPWPKSPWESAIVADAWRVLHGQAVYTDPASGHATHMYGPLITYMCAPLVKCFNADPRIPRTIGFLCVIILSISAAIVIPRRGDWWMRLFLAALCFLQFYRAAHYSSEGRPDAIALLLAAVALGMFYRSQIHPRFSAATIWMLCGTAAMIVAFFFKQTALTAGSIPILAALCHPSTRNPPRIGLACIPLLAGILAVGILKTAFPLVYFYMVTVPASYPVKAADVGSAVLLLLRADVLIIAIAVTWVGMNWRKLWKGTADPLAQFLLVTVIVTALAGSIARAKPGGYLNSYLPAMLAGAMFIARIFPKILQRIATWQWYPLAYVAIGIVAAGLLVMDLRVFSGRLDPGPATQQKGDNTYLRVIGKVRRLPGKVISPDDPTIALRTKGYAGRSGDCELDAHPVNGRRALPQYALNELAGADWVVQIKETRTTRRAPVLSERVLSSHGFELASGVAPTKSCYVIWKRIRPATSQSGI